MTPTLDATTARRLRLTSLLLADKPGDPGRPTGPVDVAGVVEWFGAMQAQDLGSGLWSLGTRLPHLDKAGVEAALERREALRTWPMRGTVHLVPPRDARWMLDLMGARPLAGAAKRRAFLGLPDDTAERAVDVLGTTLAGGKRLTRAECLAALADAGIGGNENWGYHLLWYASQRGVTCIAPNVGKEQTFVLLDDWVPNPNQPSRDEALATIATRYVRSHGPATRQDFAGWTGFGAAEARAALALATDAVGVATLDGQEVLVAPELLDLLPSTDDLADTDVWALAGFDEFLLGYKDRSLVLGEGHLKAVIPGSNGVFRPTIVRGGQVVATWTRTTTKTKVTVSVAPLVTLKAADRRRVESALAPYARFLGLDLVVRWP